MPPPPEPQDDDSESESDSLWLRRLTFRDNKIRIKVHEEWGAGIGGTLWEGAVLMARWLSLSVFAAQSRMPTAYLRSCDKTFETGCWQGARCIELGAGATGIPGIVATHLGCFREVVITDIEDCLERLRENVAASLPAAAHLSDVQALHNPAAADQSEAAEQRDAMAAAGRPPAVPAAASSECSPGWDGKTCVRVEELDWRDSAGHMRAPYDVVLVADVVRRRDAVRVVKHDHQLYAEELVDPLLATLQRFSTPQSLVVIAIYNRSERTSALFWERLPHYFASSEKIPEERFASPTQPDNIGIFILHH